MELNELRKVAEQATTGPWEVMNPSGCASWIAAKSPSRKFVGKGMSEQDAEHIATFDPPTVLALITELETFRRRLDAMRRQRDGYRNQLRKTEQQIQRVRAFLEYRKANSAVARDGLRALDGDTRRLADQGLGDNLARTTKNGENNE